MGDRFGDWDSRSSRRVVVDGECTGVVGGSEKGLADDAEEGPFSFMVVVDANSKSVSSFQEVRRFGVEALLLARAVDSFIGIMRSKEWVSLGSLTTVDQWVAVGLLL
jgi:hypothetical protein